MMYMIIALAALVCLGGSPNGNWESQELLRHKVEIVVLQVNVLDENGIPIRNLSAKDFEVREGRKTCKIESVEFVDYMATGAVTATAGTPEGRRQFLLLFDLSFSNLTGIRKAQQAGLYFLQQGISANDLVAVATISARGGIRLLCPFSPDRSQAIHAISTLELADQLRFRDPAGFAFDQELREIEDMLKKMEESGESDPALEQLRDVLRMSQASARDSYAGVVANYAVILRIMAEGLNGLRGRKNVILFSEGFDQDVLTGQNLDDLARQSEAWQNLNTQSATLGDTRAMAGSQGTVTDFQKVLRELSHGNAVFYAIDISRFAEESGDAGQMVSTSGAARRRSGQAALLQFADETNGELYANLNRLETALEDIARKTSCAYLISFKPSKQGKPGEFREISISVKRPGLRVRHQRGYSFEKLYSDFSPAEKQLQLAEFVVKDLSGGGIPFRFDAVAFDGNEQYARLPMIVEIDGPVIAAAPGRQGKDNIRLEVYGYLLGEHNVPLDFFSDFINFTTKEAVDNLEKSGIKYYGLLTAPPGSYKVKCIVRDSELGMISAQTMRMEVPDFGKRRLHISGPVFIEMRGGRLNFFNNVKLEASGRLEGRPVGYSYQWGERTLAPAVNPPCSAAVPELVFMRLHGLDTSAGMPKVEMRFELVGEGGQARQVSPKSLVDKKMDAGTGTLDVVLQFGLGELGLQPGQYRLRVYLTDPVSGASAAAEAPFIIP
ncbi:MAG TPA: VWA domain-containing protein [Acidobacteriota bacterium]|nr:VWA domain-containing protein [Acidobacteriota bacterium]